MKQETIRKEDTKNILKLDESRKFKKQIQKTF